MQSYILYFIVVLIYAYLIMLTVKAIARGIEAKNIKKKYKLKK